MKHETKHLNGDTENQPRLLVRNIGGIASATFAISPGVTLLSGRNASNKSSMLRALAGVLGGPLPPVKSDSTAGAVELAISDTEYALQLDRRDGTTVATHSEVYSSRGELCELFVALTETNPIRQAILAGDDLYPLLMRPVDMTEIVSKIASLRDRKDALDARLEEIDAAESRLPGLRSRRETLQERKAELEATLRAKRNEVEAREAESEDVTGDLKDKRQARNEVRSRIRTQADAIESLESELDEVTAVLAEQQSDVPEAAVEDISAELDRLHHQKQDLTATINALSPIIDMNSQLLDGEGDIPDAMTADSVVSELNPASRTLSCWTCGSTVERDQITEQVETIDALVVEKRNERDTITNRIRSLTEQKRELTDRAERIERLRDRRDEMASDVERRRAKLETLQSNLRDLESDIEELRRETIDDPDGEAKLRDLYDDISDSEYERGRVANDLDSVEAEIDELESEVAAREDTETERESVAADLREQRQRIERIERNLVNTFNEMMQEVLDALGYDTIERIWLERQSNGSGRVSSTTFELHVVRANDDGAVYDDTVESLSKSEREVIGLVVALAGYLAHDVGDIVPFLVVDAVEMFDADRIDRLMELFDEHADYVVAAVLPEEAYELAETYDTVSTQSFAGTS